MATFHVGQKTNPTVLPQQLALELRAADNLGVRDETGSQGRETASGVEHVRGETVDRAPAVDGVTPNPLVGEEARECHPAVFVLDKHGEPLQPTTPARARKLLRNGRAVVARHTPFVIRLKDRTAAESENDGVEVGVDPGSKHTGIAVFTAQAGERRSRYAIQLDHRGAQIKKRVGQRAAYRRGRRARNLRYRAPRFLNRAHPQGWLPPSLRHRVDSTVAWMERLARWVPLRSVHVEQAAFDTYALGAEVPPQGTDYQEGSLAGCEVREYLLAKWGRACAYCGAEGVPLNVEHIRPRARGGSDRESNLTLACVPCNQAKGSRPVEEFLADRPEQAWKVLAHAEAPLRDAAVINSTRRALFLAIDARWPTQGASGGRTRYNRQCTGLIKTHTLDALAVGELESISETASRVLMIGCTGRGSYARTRTDKYGFPRLRLPRRKGFFGFVTGDLVRAVVPSGKRRGAYVGRVAVRSSGKFNVVTRHGTMQSIHHKHIRLLQRADGYAYTFVPEVASNNERSSAGRHSPSSPGGDPSFRAPAGSRGSNARTLG
ncbi:RNA-guided endonuclease IscB [Streptomyces sp. NPDC017179]|uniref:RNA-guided endonuclease IscB n=1 Tax=Streptomyces sp. NPDC017179 TaxID=3364979 RepID=UPI0037AFB4FE